MTGQKLDSLGRTRASKKGSMKKSEEDEINETMLDEISEAYINDTSAWNNIDQVEVKLTELSEQLSKTKHERKRKQINCLISTYEIQYKSLLMAKASAQSMTNESMLGSTYMSPIEVENKESDKSLESEVDTIMSEIENEPTEFKEDETSKRNENETSKRSQDGSDFKKIPTTKRKQVTIDENVQVINITKQEVVNSYANVLKKVKGNECGDFTTAKALLQSQTENKKVKNPKMGEIRLRFQFKGKNNGTTSKQEQLQELLYGMMHCSKMVDPSSMLLPWEENSEEKALNGKEVKLLTELQLMKYVDLQTSHRTFVNGRMYYQNGIRLKTQLKVEAYVHEWSQWKYATDDNNPFKDWKPVRPAEMQGSSKAYALGYFAGSTENGDYQTLCKEIKNITEMDIELSYQLIHQRGVTNHIWKYAREMAEKESLNPNSKLHKQVKFNHALSGLVAYIGDVTKVKLARRVLTEKLGKMQQNLWPLMPDGSRMRFTPILQSYVRNDKLYNHLYRTMWTQSVSKGGEIYLDLEMEDLYTPKDYLNGWTLEYVIHSAQSSLRPGMPIFKHITKKWTKDYDECKKQVAVSSCMHEEAIDFIKKMNDYLIETFGDKVKRHFVRHPTMNIAHSQQQQNKETDEDLDLLMTTLGEEDNYQEILIEGMELLKDTRAASSKKATKKDTQSQGKYMEQTAQNDQTQMSTIAKWEEMSLGTSIKDMQPLTDKEKRKTQNTIKANNITSNDIEIWKTKNMNNVEAIKKKAKRQEYEFMKRIVTDILNDRRATKENDAEVDSLANLMSIAEESNQSSKGTQRGEHNSNREISGATQPPDSKGEDDHEL